MPGETKMNKEQFEALMNMLEAIYCATVGRPIQSQSARSKALDYVGEEHAKSKGWTPAKEGEHAN